MSLQEEFELLRIYETLYIWILNVGKHYTTSQKYCAEFVCVYI